MNALANIIARHRTPAIGGAGIDSSREAGFVASHYRYYRNARKMPASAALAAAKALPATYCKGFEWYGSTGNVGAAREEAGESLRWVEDTRAAGLRFVGWSDELGAASHSGWFTDEFEERRLRGGVWQTPGSKGVSRLLYGYAEFEGRDVETNPGSACLCVSDVVRQPMRDETDGDLSGSEGARDAARWGDSMAESVAEDERDYQETYRRGEAAAEAHDAAIEARRELLPLLAEMRPLRRGGYTPLSPAARVCGILMGKVESLLETISTKREARDSAWGDCPKSDEAAFLAGFMDSEGGSFVAAVRLGWMAASDWQGAPEANPCHAGGR